MEIKELKDRPELKKSLAKSYTQFNTLLTELRKRELTEAIVDSINLQIDRINSILESEKELKTQIRKSKSIILKLIYKDLKLVTKNHYRTTWLVLGMSVFGIPIGVALGNIALWMPLGMMIGIALGTGMDAKARKEDRQLNI
jgi:hypothetical protein